MFWEISSFALIQLYTLIVVDTKNPFNMHINCPNGTLKVLTGLVMTLTVPLEILLLNFCLLRVT